MQGLIVMNLLHSLHRLCADYDRLGGSSFLVDFPALDRWYLRAERVMEDSFVPAASDGRVCTALCRCLTCYFYQSPSARDDEWPLPHLLLLPVPLGPGR